MNSPSTLILKRDEVAGLLTIEECMEAVENAFRLHAEGKATPPKILALHVPGGGFHIKAGVMDLRQSYFVAKLNANFPGNPKLNGHPTIQGVIMIYNAHNGLILAVMDSIEITVVRTGAATGVAAKYLARRDARIMTICGCGNQGRISLKAVMAVRKLEKVYAHDIDQAKQERFSKELSQALNVTVIPAGDAGIACRQSDIIVTCTTAREPFLFATDIKPGTFIAAVGADSENKQEIHPAVLASGKVVADLLEQSATIGELHHALADGLMTRNDVHAELGEIVAGLKPGRTTQDEIFVFDSTGTALQDVAATAIVYEKALATGVGLKINLGN